MLAGTLCYKKFRNKGVKSFFFYVCLFVLGGGGVSTRIGRFCSSDIWLALIRKLPFYKRRSHLSKQLKEPKGYILVGEVKIMFWFRQVLAALLIMSMKCPYRDRCVCVSGGYTIAAS